MRHALVEWSIEQTRARQARQAQPHTAGHDDDGDASPARTPPLQIFSTLCADTPTEYWDIDTDYPTSGGPPALGRPVAALAALISGQAERGFDDVVEPDHDVALFRAHRAVWAQKHGLLTTPPPADAFTEQFRATTSAALAVDATLLQPALLWGWVLPALVMANAGALGEREARDWCAVDLLTVMDYRAMAADSEPRRRLLAAARGLSADGELRVHPKWLEYANVVVCRAGERGLAGRCAAAALGNVPLFERGRLSDVEIARWAVVDMGLPNWLRRRYVSRAGLGLVALPRLTNDMSDLMTDVLRGEPGNIFRLRRDLRLWFAHYGAWLCGRWPAVERRQCEPAELAAAVTMPYSFLGRRSRTWSKLAAAYALGSGDGPRACPWCALYEAQVADLHAPFSVRRGERGPRGGAARVAAYAMACAYRLVGDCGGTVAEAAWAEVQRRVERYLADAPIAGGHGDAFYTALGRVYGVLAVPILLLEGGHLGASAVDLMELIGYEYLRYDAAQAVELAIAVYAASVACHPHPTLSLGTLEIGLLYGRPLTPHDIPLHS